MEQGKQNIIIKYVKESIRELTHVTWPTKNQAVNISITVVVFVFICALIIAGIDFVFNKGYGILLQLR